MAVESRWIADPVVRKYAAIPASTGRISKFGGPGDSMESSKLMAIQPWPGNKPKSEWYCALPFMYVTQKPYQGAPINRAPGCTDKILNQVKKALRAQKIWVRSPKTGRVVVLWAADWGPATYLRRLVDVSPKALDTLGIKTDATVEVGFADPSLPVGPASAGAVISEPRAEPAQGERNTAGLPVKQGPAPDETAPPPIAPLVAGLGIYAPNQIRIGHRGAHADLTILSGQLSRSISEPSSLELEFADPNGEARRHPTFTEASTSVLDGIQFTLTEMDANADTLRTKLVDATAARLMAHKWTADGVISQQGGTGTRGDFIRRIVKTVDPDLAVDIQPGQQTLVQLAVKAGDSAWQSIRTAADDVNWRAFTTANRLVVGADEWLAKRTPPIPVSRATPGVHSIEWRMMPGVIPSDATITADALQWAAPPSQAITITGEGPADGVWIVEQVTKDLFSTRVQIQLTRKEPALSEPPPEPEPSAGGSDGPARGQWVAGDFQPPANKMCNPDWPKEGSKWIGTMYDWGGRGQKGRGVDCSGLIIASLRPFGITAAARAREQLLWVRQIPVEQALATYGAVVGRINPPGSKASGHIAISLGDGRILEAPRTGQRVRITKWRKDLNRGGLIPGVTYG